MMSKRYERAKLLTKKYASKLAKCSCCGKNAEIVIEREIMSPYSTSNGYYYCVQCTTPRCDFATGKTLRETMKKWNERHEKKK